MLIYILTAIKNLKMKHLLNRKIKNIQIYVKKVNILILTINFKKVILYFDEKRALVMKTTTI